MARPPYATYDVGRHNATGPALVRSMEHPDGLPRGLPSSRQRREAPWHVPGLTGSPWFASQPSPGLPSILRLPEGVTLLRRPGLHTVTPDLCKDGGQGPAPCHCRILPVDLTGLASSATAFAANRRGRTVLSVSGQRPPPLPPVHRLSRPILGCRREPLPLWPPPRAVVRAAVNDGRASPAVLPDWYQRA